MYLQNKYTSWYFSIINNSKNKNNGTEKHHIIPKCLGGNNSKDNIALLTAREHFICHLLLPKMTSGANKAKMYHALSMMLAKPKQYIREFKVTSTVYETVRKEISLNMKNRWKDNDFRKNRSNKMSGDGNHFYGKTHSEDTIQKMKNKVFSDETKHRMSVGQKKRFENSPGTFKGRKHSEETKLKLSAIRKKKLLTLSTE